MPGDTKITLSPVSLGKQSHQLEFEGLFTSDIAGANLARWNSVLVHTGVYDPRYRSSLPKAKAPTFEAKDVEEAVRLAIHEQIQFT